MNRKRIFCAFVGIAWLQLTSIAAVNQIPEAIRNIYKDVLPFKFVDFDVSMQIDLFPKSIAVTRRVVSIDGNELMDFFRQLYQKNNLSNIEIQQELTIPKIIHQIWLGSPVPQAFKELMRTWIEYHLERGWKYKLWTDEDVKDFPLYNREFYEATDNYGIKSDILKWEIIYNYGGVYVDMDYECLKPLDIRHYAYDFYTGIQPLDAQFVHLGAALFAAKPGHPILKHCIETVKDDWHNKGAPAKTGPVHFTKSFFAMAGKNSFKDIALPASYLYPLGCRDSVIDRDKWIQGGAYAVHWWSKSWMPPKYRPQQFRELDNDKSCESWND